ncbi:hypothetical protein Bbelb_369790 [Branchiostoma belcheri]|nr:hypothetical protein Bbelb_369790 [Branchiostoma belcheri]
MVIVVSLLKKPTLQQKKHETKQIEGRIGGYPPENVLNFLVAIFGMMSDRVHLVMKPSHTLASRQKHQENNSRIAAGVNKLDELEVLLRDFRAVCVKTSRQQRPDTRRFALDGRKSDSDPPLKNRTIGSEVVVTTIRGLPSCDYFDRL